MNPESACSRSSKMTARAVSLDTACRLDGIREVEQTLQECVDLGWMIDLPGEVGCVRLARLVTDYASLCKLRELAVDLRLADFEGFDDPSLSSWRRQECQQDVESSGVERLDNLGRPVVHLGEYADFAYFRRGRRYAHEEAETELASVVETEASPCCTTTTSVLRIYYLAGGGGTVHLLCGGFPGLRPGPALGRSRAYTCTVKIAWCSDMPCALSSVLRMAGQQKSATTEKREPLATRDEPLKIDLDPEVALRALLKVDPDAPPVKAPSDGQRPTRG